MAYIKVDIAELEKTAAVVDEYVAVHKKRTAAIDRTMDGLNASWQGTDYDQVRKQWKEMIQKGSTSNKMLQSLEHYADSLRSAGAAYKNAKERAINRAKTRCK